MTSVPKPDIDPYIEKPSFWKVHADEVWTVSVFVLTVLLTVLSFPPYTAAEFGYAFAVPAIFWAYIQPSFKRFAWTVLAANGVAWTIMLGWLHHVTWLGLLLLGPFIGIWVGLWYLAIWWVVPRMKTKHTRVRIITVFGLAALWVLNEWLRTWLLSGFPWLPLAASQWQRSVVLQIASYTGASGVSFILIVFNLGFAAYAHRLFREKHTGLRKRSPEFMAALMTLMFPTFYLIITETSQQRREPFLKVAVVQPAIPQLLKWDPSQSDMIFNTLGGLTARAASNRPNLILWPEASTPFAVKGDPRVQAWVEELAKKTATPLLLGSIAIENPGTPQEYYQNAAFIVDPVSGLQSSSYAKRHLVPFGEYVPFRSLLGWIGKFVPVGEGDFVPGDDRAPLVLPTYSGPVAIAPLICYEDIFPSLARTGARDGADVFAVLTNNAWYGTGGAAYQHAAHSVLRAVETRRPFLRCGNNGWSGWIDEYGNARKVMQNEKSGVYFRGTESWAINRDVRWVGRTSFYTQHGEWFVLTCAAVVVLAWIVLQTAPPMPVEEPAKA